MARLNRPAAAQFLKDNGLPIAPNTLAKKAVDGSGPPYQVWNGQATYDTADLLEWAAQRLGPKLTSTADRRRNSTAVAQANDQAGPTSKPNRFISNAK
jgi:hypothetical protein